MMHNAKKIKCFLVPDILPPGFNYYTEDGFGKMRNGSIVFQTESDDSDWLIVGDSACHDLYTDIPRERRILFVAEPPSIRKYEKRYVSQFGHVVTPRPIKGYKGNALVENTYLGWSAGSGRDRLSKDSTKGNLPRFRKISDVKKYKCRKTKVISIITSLKKITSGHKKRVYFLNSLRKYFGESVDCYGRDFAPIDDKIEGIAPYRYHIAIENFRLTNYWTEKLSDAWISWALPIYYGDPTILEQVPDPNGIELIDINNIHSAMKKIEKILSDDNYEDRIDAIKKCRDWVLKQSNRYEKTCQIIENNTQFDLRYRLKQKELICVPREKLIKAKCYTMLKKIFGEKS